MNQIKQLKIRKDKQPILLMTNKKQKRENVDKEDEEDPLEGMTQSEKNFLKAKMLQVNKRTNFLQICSRHADAFICLMQEEKMIKKKIKKANSGREHMIQNASPAE